MLSEKTIVDYVFAHKPKIGVLITIDGSLVNNLYINEEDLEKEINLIDIEEYQKAIVYTSVNPGETKHIKVKVIEEFMKFDTNKVRYDLVPPEFIKDVAEVITLGAKKYNAYNWTQCKDPDKYIAAMFRHIEAWRQGEVNDPESSLPHLAHAATNIAFLMHLKYNPKQWIK